VTCGARSRPGFARRLRSRLRSRAGGDEGVSSIELILYAPILMMATFMVVQFALSYLANEAASSAAREAARVARSEGGTPQALRDGQAKGEQILTSISGGMLLSHSVTVTLTPNGDVQAVVTGEAKDALPFPSSLFNFPISQKVVGPIEQFRPDQ
jgi:Flp pilus assembly protein TadG